jgi:GGDEF domain-containing protein
LQLLGQSGHPLPDFAQVGQTVWLQSVIDALCDLSSRDALTGLSNRRQFELALAREIDRVARAGEPALVLMVDIDRFKMVNDTHGHAAGDLVLKAVAASLMSCVRPMDTVARFGGEEFAIILPNCPPAFGGTAAVADGHDQPRRGVRAAVGALVGHAVDRTRRPAALPRQARGPQPRLPRAAAGVAGQRRGKGHAVQYLAVPGH